MNGRVDGTETDSVGFATGCVFVFQRQIIVLDSPSPPDILEHWSAQMIGLESAAPTGDLSCHFHFDLLLSRLK